MLSKSTQLSTMKARVHTTQKLRSACYVSTPSFNRLLMYPFHFNNSRISLAAFFILGSVALASAVEILFSIPYTSFAALLTSSSTYRIVPVATKALKMTSESACEDRILDSVSTIARTCSKDALSLSERKRTA